MSYECDFSLGIFFSLFLVYIKWENYLNWFNLGLNREIFIYFFLSVKDRVFFFGRVKAKYFFFLEKNIKGS